MGLFGKKLKQEHKVMLQAERAKARSCPSITAPRPSVLTQNAGTCTTR